MTVAARSQNVCLEDTVGDLFRKMVFTDALVYTTVTLSTYAIVKVVRGGEKIECAEFAPVCCVVLRRLARLMYVCVHACGVAQV